MFLEIVYRIKQKLQWHVKFSQKRHLGDERQVRIQRGGGGGQGVCTPGKSQVIWVSIGNKQLDPPPLEKVGPPGKCWTPSGTLKNDRFLLN